MKRIIALRLALVALCLALLCAACGTDSAQRGGGTTPSGGAGEGQAELSTEELARIDGQLDDIEARAKALDERVAELEGRVVDKVGESVAGKLESQLQSTTDLYLEVDKNGLFKLNGVTMTQTEFQRFADKRRKTLCQPEPVLVVDPAASYDTVAWVLETIYAQGCGSVAIKERSLGN